MMAKGTFTIENPQALTDFINRLDAIASESVLRQAVVGGAAIIRDEVVLLAPEKRGVLKSSVLMKHADELSFGGSYQTYIVTVRSGTRGEDGKKDLSNDAYYWRWVERGHRIVPRETESGVTTFTQRLANGDVVTRTRAFSGTSLRARRRAVDANAVEVGTSKVPAHPFMRPAFETKKTAAAQAIMDFIQQKADEAANG